MNQMDATNFGYTTGLNTSSAIINSQLVPQTKTQWYTPFAVGPVIQGIPASPPQSPPGYASQSGSQMSDTARMAAQNPWHPVHSPVPWLIGMFLVGVILFRWVHWGYDFK
jgi:hypothetical protein